MHLKRDFEAYIICDILIMVVLFLELGYVKKYSGTAKSSNLYHCLRLYKAFP